MKKIIIDIFQLHPQALKRGVGIYALSLYQGLKALKDGNEYCLKKNKGREKSGKKANLIHYPYFDPFFLTLPCRGRIPVVVTVHDLTPLKFPSHYPAGIKGRIKWQRQKYLLKKVDAIITDSQNSKKDIVEIIGYPENKIFSIPLAVSNEFRKLENGNWELGIKGKYHLPDVFLLYVGDLNWNKNVKSLVKTFYKLKDVDQNLKLVLIGSAFNNKSLKELKMLKKQIKRLKLNNDVKLFGFIPTKDLVKIYNLAILYIQPSFYEGFGLPVLEAMSCGCPVLSSNQASLPEVGGKAVEYFNPFKKDDLEMKLKSLVKNKLKLKKISKLGLKQAQKFSWKKTAEQTAKVYQKVLKNEA